MRVNSAFDHLNYTTHLCLSGALLVGTAYHLNSPKLMIAAATIAAVEKFIISPIRKTKWRNELPQSLNLLNTEKDEILDFRYGVEKDLLKRGKKLADKMGFKKTPEFHVLKNNPIEKQSIAFSHQKQRVIYTQRLIDILDRDEQGAVTAHELVHLKAKHVRKWEAVSIVNHTAGLAMTLNMGLVMLSSYQNLGIAAGVVVSAIAGMFATDHLTSKPFQNNQSKINMGGASTLIAAGLGLSYAFNNFAMAGALGAAFLVKNAGTLINRNLSRQNEYQADRIAGQVIENPEVMADALKKLDHTLDQRQSFLTKAFQAVYHTHPPTEKRMKRLMKQQKKMKPA